MKLALLALLVVAPSVALGADGEDAIPRPAGWIGTTEQWTQGLGIALALLNLVVLFVAWRALRQADTARGVTGTLFFGLAVLPVVVIFFGYTQGLSGMETVRAAKIPGRARRTSNAMKHFRIAGRRNSRVSSARTARNS